MAVAEEVVQDAFVQLYRNWASIERPPDIQTCPFGHTADGTVLGVFNDSH